MALLTDKYGQFSVGDSVVITAVPTNATNNPVMKPVPDGIVVTGKITCFGYTTTRPGVVFDDVALVKLLVPGIELCNLQNTVRGNKGTFIGREYILISDQDWRDDADCDFASLYGLLAL